MSHPEAPPAPRPASPLPESVRGSWQRFLNDYEALRPELYRYSRHLTRTPWDAEDLTQDTLMRAFVTLAQTGESPANARAWLLRVASNLWIDRVRKSREPIEVEPAPAPVEPRAQREAAGTLLVRLSPQERAAVVLKDVFDLTLEEVAEALSTSVGAVKAALHRGRGKLLELPPSEAAPALPAALNAFCDAFNARDLPRLQALLLDGASVEVVGVTTEYAHGGPSKILWGMLFGSERLADAETRGGIEARFVEKALPDPPRLEARFHRGEWLLLSWYAHADGEAVRAVNRLEVSEDRVARVLNYFFTPDFLAEVCAELGVPFRSNGYRFWLTGC
jgi:RNA polymerase sigma-70 factor (ECF subfamily)